ncbi:MAG: serine/threonine-protein kinase [Myxococcota bacterium]
MRPLGAGGMAETAVAVRRGPGGFEQTVCLKRILSAFTEDARFVTMFLHEARIAARMRHNNIVQVFDFGDHDGSYYMALELVEGLDLRRLMTGVRGSGEPLSIELLAFVVYELLGALSYAHNLKVEGEAVGLVHRDVTPSNVLISIHGEVKLADFGIAKATSTAAATKTGSIKGKIPYMAPEQAEGKRVDRRTDLFALGVVMYEMLAGRRPFDGPTDTATLLNISKGQFTPLHVVAPEAPEPLRQVVEQLLSRDPEARFQDAASVVDAIVDFVPPPTTRRKLGALVRELRVDAQQQRMIGHAETEHAEPPPPESAEWGAAPEVAPRISDMVARATPPPGSERVPAPAPATDRTSTPVASPAVPAEETAETLAYERDAPPFVAAAPAAPPKSRSAILLIALGGAAALLLGLGVLGAGAVLLSHNNDGAPSDDGPAPEAPAEREVGTSTGPPSPREPPTTVPPTTATNPLTQPPSSSVAVMGSPTGMSDPSTNTTAMNDSLPQATEPAPAEEPAAATEEPATPGTLRVSVIPYGKIWINGSFAGNARVERRLAPGRYTVRAGRTQPTVSRQVEVRSGETTVANLRAR